MSTPRPILKDASDPQPSVPATRVSSVTDIPLSLRAALPLLVPCLILLIWHAQNQGWPNDDAANYATTAYQLFSRFRDHGLIAGVIGVLNIRGWRPILFPVLLVPYLLVFHGNLVLAVAGLLWTLYCSVTAYFFRLCRLFLPEYRAAICTTVVVTGPFVALFGTVMFSELAWVLFSVAWLYYLLRAQQFTDWLRSALGGACLGLMMAIRPAESVAMAIIPIALVTYYALRRRAVSRIDLLLVCPIVVVPGGLLGASLFFPLLTRKPVWFLFGVTLGLCVVAVKRHPAVSRGYVSFWAAAAGVSVFWWANFMKPLYEWAYTTSFGHMAKVTAPPRDAHATLPALVSQTFQVFGAFQIWSLIGITFLFLIVEALVRRLSVAASNRKPQAEPPFWLLGASVLGTLVPIFLLYLFSGTADPRRALVAVSLLVAVLAIKIADISGPLPRLGLIVVAAVAALQVYLLSGGLFGWPTASPSLAFWTGEISRPPTLGRDGNSEVSEILAAKLPRHSSVAVYTMALFSVPNRIYEPAALILGSNIEGTDITAGYLWDEEKVDRVLHRLSGFGYHYLLLDSWDDPSVRQSHQPYVHFTSALLDALKKSTVPGLTLLDTFMVHGRTQWLFVISADQPSLVMAGNIAASAAGARAIATDHQAGYDVAFINDGTSMPWGSSGLLQDTYAGVVLPQPQAVNTIRIIMFSPAGHQHLRDISIVAADSEPSPTWHLVRARLEGSESFSTKITLPPLPDNTGVTLEVDQADLGAGLHRLWGIACFKDYARNYVPAGAGIYFRELQMTARQTGNRKRP